MMPPVFIKFIKFCFVGFCGMIIDFGITYILKEKFRIQKYFANACGFITAATVNYIFNRIWTFHSSNPSIGIEYTKFIIISFIGLGINSVILWLLVSRLKKNFYFAKLIAIGVTTLWNFIANLMITFL